MVIYIPWDILFTHWKVWSFNENTQQAELNKFDNVTITNYNAEIYQIELEDGRIIKGTADHPCLTQRGWIQIQNLLGSDYIIDISNSINL
jgi:intein/homing endonuclease